MKSKRCPGFSQNYSYNWLDALIVDDNSADGTAKVVEDWPDDLGRFSYNT